MTRDTWKLRLFGGFRLESPTGEVFVTKAKRASLLLSYLALCPKNATSRKSLALAIFEDDEIAPYSNFALLLTRLVSSLKKVDPLPFLQATRDEVSLDLSNITIDIKQFGSLLTKAHAEPNPVKKASLLLTAMGLADEKLLPEPRPALLLPFIEQTEAKVLNLLAELSTLPLTGEQREIVFQRIRTLEPEAKQDSNAMEHLIRSYGNLGYSDLAVKLFTDYEDWMSSEYGESPRAGVVKALQEVNDEGRTGSTNKKSQPGRPALSVGRESQFAKVEQFVVNESAFSSMTLAGMSGVGKSHLLRETYWRLKDTVKVAFFDLSYELPESVLADVSDNPIQLLILDEADRNNAWLIEKAVAKNPGLKVLSASHNRLGIEREQVLQLQPLSFENGEANRLLDAYLVGSQKDETGQSLSLKDELVRLCEGIPLALEISGKLASSIGLESTVRSLRANSAALAGNVLPKPHHQSLTTAILRSYSHLSDSARRLVLAVSANGSRMPADLALYASEMSLGVMEEAILSGLITTEEGIFIRASTAVSRSVVDLDGEKEDEFLFSFSMRVCPWFKLQSDFGSQDLRLSPALSVGINTMKALKDRGKWNLANELLISMEPWFASYRLSDAELEVIASMSRFSEGDLPTNWGEAVVSLAIVYHYKGKTAEMLELLESSLARDDFEGLTPPIQATILTQAGLAQNILLDFPKSEGYYRRAINLAQSNGLNKNLVHAWFNFGVALEGQGMLKDAQSAYETSARYFTEASDERLKIMVRSGMARLAHRLDGDLDRATFIYISTAMRALQNNDKRSTAEIILNLALVYRHKEEYALSAYMGALGLSLLAELGFTWEFRLYARSALAMLSSNLYRIGLTSPALTSRLLVDRLGEVDFDPPAVAFYQEIVKLSFPSPESNDFDIASEHEVSQFLAKCIAQLKVNLANHQDESGLALLLESCKA